MLMDLSTINHIIIGWLNKIPTKYLLIIVLVDLTKNGKPKYLHKYLQTFNHFNPLQLWHYG